MMFFHRREEKSFVGVALLMILLGAAIFAYGAVGWLVNVTEQELIIATPSQKIIGGLVVISLGYIQLELSLLRRK
ncbi:MAG: hypothetical protein AAB499_02385 [Patescibacteria group bacterium]